MIIISQDKEKIVNFSNIQEMNIEEWSTMKEGKVIWFYVINAEKSKDYQTEIGRYSTKERAKEVLQEILERYDVLKKNTTYAQGDSGFTFNGHYYYEMPKE